MTQRGAGGTSVAKGAQRDDSAAIATNVLTRPMELRQDGAAMCGEAGDDRSHLFQLSKKAERVSVMTMSRPTSSMKTPEAEPHLGLEMAR